MADYDVQALGLASPPPSAPATTYYPGVSVRNNGVHPANVSGYVRQYDRDTGLLIQTFNVARTNLLPGDSGTAPAAAPLVWTPADIGKKFLFQGFVTCDRDSVPANNYFGPVEVVVTGETPPPPPIQTHAAQHQNGGADELTLDGLGGRLAEKQDPTEHASSHGDGGADQLSVDGLHGQLADDQPVAAHANEKHTIPFATESQLSAHDTSEEAHEDVYALLHRSQLGEDNGVASLDEDAEIPIDQLPLTDLKQEFYNAPEGFAGLDANAQIFPAQIPASILRPASPTLLSAPNVTITPGITTVWGNVRLQSNEIPATKRASVDFSGFVVLGHGAGTEYCQLNIHFGPNGNAADPVVLSKQISIGISIDYVVEVSARVALVGGPPDLGQAMLMAHVSNEGGSYTAVHRAGLGSSFYPSLSNPNYITVTIYMSAAATAAGVQIGRFLKAIEP